MDLSRRNDDACEPCPFSQPGKGDTSDPIYQNPPSSNDPNCFVKNREAFLLSLDAVLPSAPRDITKDGCKALAANRDGGEIFLALYGLDQKYCGLGHSKDKGDDREFPSGS